MDAITKDSKEWLAALGLVPGKWNPGPCERCHVLDFNPAETLPSGNIAVHHIEHDVPTPDITPDLLYAILEAGFKACSDFWTRVAWELADEHKPADAIIRAAASLQEAK